MCKLHVMRDYTACLTFPHIVLEFDDCLGEYNIYTAIIALSTTCELYM